MNNLEIIMSNFPKKHILVVGDIMLDKYLEGDISRISQEAPVPIVSLKKEFYELGGAANVAANIVSLGGKVSLFGFAGNDTNGIVLKQLLVEKGIGCFLDETAITTEKTRILSSGQHLLRFDKEEINEKTFSDKIKQRLKEEAAKADIILVSDYAKGVVNSDLFQLLDEYNLKIIIDPKPKNKELYKKVFLITPNEKEAIEMADCSDPDLAGEMLSKELNSNVIVTRGKSGMTIFADRKTQIPTYAKEVFDVTGAGDTAIASLALAIASGASLEEAAIISNHAAGIAVEKKGTYQVRLSELKERIFSREKKVVSLEELKMKLEGEKRKGKKIVWTNGCFDLLHVGHTRYLKETKKLGDVLVIGLNSDSSVRTLKGPSRPIQTESERAEILSALEFVDYVVIYPELNSSRYIREVQPDIVTKGGDYKEIKNEEERRALEEVGGKFVSLPFVEGRSTTNILKAINNPNNGGKS